MAIVDAIAKLDEAVGDFLNSSGTDNAKILAAVFRLNNEIGAKLRSTGSPSMRSLQSKVSDVTIAAKRLDRTGLAEAMQRVRNTPVS